jgi:putative spermidine/putrescine transport system permease protein
VSAPAQENTSRLAGVGLGKGAAGLWRGPLSLAPSRGGRRSVPLWLVSWLQVSPLALVLMLLFALPTVLFLVVSFFDYDRVGIYPAFLLDNYRDLLTTPTTLRVYLSSLKFAVIVWAITLFLGFNIAWFLIFHISSATIRTVLFLLCAVPFWTSGIIRTIAWIPFLGRNGAFNQMLMALGITREPLSFLLFSDFAVIVTYVNLFTLLMVGPIANSMAKIDPALIEAAVDAGASRWRVMTDVVIPLSKTGIALGSILVFTQVMGDYFVVRQMPWCWWCSLPSWWPG